MPKDLPAPTNFIIKWGGSVYFLAQVRLLPSPFFISLRSSFSRRFTVLMTDFLSITLGSRDNTREHLHTDDRTKSERSRRVHVGTTVDGGFGMFSLFILVRWNFLFPSFLISRLLPLFVQHELMSEAYTFARRRTSQGLLLGLPEPSSWAWQRWILPVGCFAPGTIWTK